jgi:hypothetical protein
LYCRHRRGKADGDTNKQNEQNTSGYLNDAFTNDYENIGKLLPKYIAEWASENRRINTLY